MYTFLSLCNLLLSCNVPMTSTLYYDEKTYVDMIFKIFNVIQRQVLEKLKDSKYFGLMIEETMDISIKEHFIVFVIFLEAILSITCFLNLLLIVEYLN